MESTISNDSLIYENNTLLKLLLQEAQKQGLDISSLKIGTSRIESKIDKIDSKLDIITRKLDNLEQSFKDFKTETRDIEEKIIGMTSQLGRFENTVPDEQIENYYSICQNNYMNWERFDSLTQKFLPVSELIFSKLQKIPNYDPDYSPVILELCRALENELLLKVFNEYIQNVVKTKKGNQLDLFLKNERKGTFIDENNESKSITLRSGKLLNAIYKASKQEEIRLTLGQMHFLLNDVHNENIRNNSVIFKDFYSYLEKNTDSNNFLSEDYLKKIDTLVDDYRNPSAHPEFITLEMAKKCKDIMPERLDYLIDCLN